MERWNWNMLLTIICKELEEGMIKRLLVCKQENNLILTAIYGISKQSVIYAQYYVNNLSNNCQKCAKRRQANVVRPC